MTLSSLLSSIITLVFLYTVLSVFASEIQEYIATALESRAKRLRQSIRQMLGEEETIPDESLTEKIYAHSNFKSINQSAYAWVSPLVNLFRFLIKLVRPQQPTHRTTTRKSLGPSYLDGDLFAKTLLEVLKKAATDQVSSPPSGAETDLIIEKSGTKFIIKNDWNNEVLSEWIEMAINSNNVLKQEKFVEGVKAQFERVQKRSTGVYKRNSTGLSFLIGFCLAILINVDSFHIFTQLLQPDNQTATNLSSIVSGVVKKDPCKENDQACKDKKIRELVDIYDDIGKQTLPIGWVIADQSNKRDDLANNLTAADVDTMIEALNFGFFPGNENQNKVCPRENPQITACLEAVQQKLISMATSTEESDAKTLLAIAKSAGGTQLKNAVLAEVKNDDDFWEKYQAFMNNSSLQRLKLISEQISIPEQKERSLQDTMARLKKLPSQVQRIITTQGGWVKVFIGWLITAIAISMGAPFWFDV